MKLLELRKEQKSKKPDFVRQRYHTKDRLAKNWRKPRQKQSKMRRGRRGHRAMPCPGFGSPSAVRGLHASGLKPVLVSNAEQLLKLNKEEGAVISSKVGMKKRLALVDEASKNNITIINIKDIKKFVEEKKKAFEERIAKKKTEEEKKKAEKEKAKKAKKAAKEEKPAEEKAEEKKVEEKKEKDKILAQK